MKIISSIEDMKNEMREFRCQNKTKGFVPTMGYLHEGHLSLVRECVKKSDYSVVSIFVNPAQFGPGEDFEDYPRDFQRDSEILRNEGVDCLFYPSNEEMYPQGYKTYVQVYDLKNKLCGRSRPHHFTGVCTVVLKLFHIVNPHQAFFGQKDFQQAVILKRMIRDLNLDVNLRVLPIVREEGGLAVSSRNTYLTPEQRKAALRLYQSLQEAQRMVDQGERKSQNIIQIMKKNIESEPEAQIDYIKIVDTENLDPLSELNQDALVALAVFIGKVRLIDNTIIKPEG
ncbi:pantoate--beta-alanine ligase [bacterium]|nr:pantoate--beta-alanine ligase [bacterium]